MTFQASLLRTRLVPQFDLSISTGTRNQIAIRRNGDSLRRPMMSEVAALFGQRIEIPQLEHTITRCRDEPAAVRER